MPETTPTGFCLSIPYKEETIGIINVEELAFPAFRERYLSLALAVVGVCGLAVSNARAHSRLETTLSDLRQEYLRTSRLSEELRVINEELEERVRRRTLELETTLIQLKDEIEQRKTAEAVVRDQLEQKTILLRELHHRVRNNLQIISSILNLQAKKAKDPLLQQALSESQNRIRTMSTVNEKALGDSDFARINLKEYIRYLVTNLMTLYRIKPGTINLSTSLIFSTG